MVTDPPSVPQLPPASKGTERKVSAATAAAYAVSLIGMAVLEFADPITEIIPAPLRVMVGPLLIAVATWAAGYYTRTKANQISASTRTAVLEWMQPATRRR